VVDITRVDQTKAGVASSKVKHADSSEMQLLVPKPSTPELQRHIGGLFDDLGHIDRTVRKFANLGL
jgi:hypothetical protein